MRSSEVGHILVVGSINIDWSGAVRELGVLDGAVEIEKLTVAPGGHAGNCAAGLCKLGAKVRILGCVGADETGDTAIKSLAEAGVDVRHVERTSEASTGFVFIPVLPEGARILYMALGANRCFMARGLQGAAEWAETLIVFDPPTHTLRNIGSVSARRRVIFAPGGLLARAPIEVLQPLLSAAQYVILNEIEAKTLSQIERAEEAAAYLARQWGATVLITAGAQGSWMASRNGETGFQHSYPVSPVDTTGAGDAFVAGFCWALTSGLSDKEAMRVACAAGGLATRDFGAQGSLPTAIEVEGLAPGPNGRPAPAKEPGHV